MAALCGAGHNVRVTLAGRHVLSLAFVGQIALAVMLIEVVASLRPASCGPESESFRVN